MAVSPGWAASVGGNGGFPPQVSGVGNASLGWIAAKDHGGHGNGITPDAAILANIVATKLPAPVAGTLYVAPGTWVLDADFTTPKHVTLKMAPGAKFIASAIGVTLTINGPLDSPSTQIFDNSVNAFVVALAPTSVELALACWWGAILDGVADDTAAFIKAIAETPLGVDLHYSGTPLISGVLTLNRAVRLVAAGSHGTFNTLPSSYFIKKATVAGPAIDLTVRGAAMVRGGVVGQLGNTGPNIRVRAHKGSCSHVYSTGAGDDGFDVTSLGGENVNYWDLDHCEADSNGRHGIYVRGGIDTNAGLASFCHALNNGGDGIRNEGSNWNKYHACGGEGNAGKGIRFLMGVDNELDGGDFEANIGGNVEIEETELFLTVLSKNTFTTGFVDNGYYTRRLDRAAINNSFAFTPALAGSTRATKAVTAIVVAGTTATVTAAAHGYANGDSVYHTGFANVNMNGAFIISNVTANMYDVTFRADLTSAKPVSGAEAATTAKCGKTSVAVGRYSIRDGVVVFSLRLTFTSLTNITGTVQLVLPRASENIDANLASQVEIGMYSGITHAGQLRVPIIQNGSILQNFLDSIGSGLTPAQLQAAGLTAATDIQVSGRYFVPKET